MAAPFFCRSGAALAAPFFYSRRSGLGRPLLLSKRSGPGRPYNRRMFNPRPEIRALPIGDGQHCYVIDDALRDPEALVELAVRERHRFAQAPFNAYPGLELRMPDAFSAQLDDFFRLHVRARFGARRVRRMYSRLSLVTLAPSQLSPPQWQCHRDRLQRVPDECVAASVLYLFHDPALGGTSFYRPRLSERETEQLMYDAVVLDAPRFARERGLAPGYMVDGNAYFERVLTVEAAWNRLIFYDGAVFHSGHITAPERMRDDPRTGRLTLNGFFTCTRARVA